MTETLKNLKNENYEYVKYIQLVSTLVVNHQNIEKITVVKNKKSDTFILLIVNSRDEISTKRLVLKIDSMHYLFLRLAFFFIWLANNSSS